ncbi:DNA polymerase III subunit delta' [Thioalkalivibrio sp. HK1]|uniref:DNA polymerase III subunit delta' n=1 Tax=Thioalkalivibrio sp. HK1 TaxID=1469245 RepID=UPI0018CC6C3B|nr:DNA polymerase III subunit delta' [Thioalkalivibrio sp. HK1]
MIPDPLPWHDAQRARLERSIAAGAIPHALLLRGPGGNGESHFASRSAAAVLCLEQTRGSPPCGECDSCVLCASGGHPDRIDVGVREERREIVIDQIREIIHLTNLTPRIGRRKVVLIDPAERVNHHAANTLLKTLEEPPGETVFILVSTNAALLPATVRSRCQMIDFPTPAPAMALEWLEKTLVHEHSKYDAADLLEIAHGAPFGALALVAEEQIDLRRELAIEVDALLAGEDPLKIAAAWKVKGLDRVSWWIGDILAVRLRESALEGRVRSQLLPLVDQCLEIRRRVMGRGNPNEQLAIERLAITIATAGRAA